MFEDNNCPICGHEKVKSRYEHGNDEYYCKCPECGEYFITDNHVYDYKHDYNIAYLKHYLFYNKSNIRPYITKCEMFNKFNKTGWVDIYNLTPEMVENWYPKTFAEKIDKILLWIGKKSKFLGEEVIIEIKNISSLFFMTNETVDDEITNEWIKEFDFFINYLIKSQLINEDVQQIHMELQLSSIYLSLSEKGWARVDELQKTQSNNKKVFVAMSFHESAHEIREAIKKGIEEANYSSEIMDEVIHNHQIVPEMMRLIRECRFMIMDITQPNFGAYYEAGYAEGLGKEVIVTCSKEVREKKDFTCDKDKDCKYIQISTKPHFDIAQKQILVWDDYDDLAKKLKEWIKFIIGTI